MTNDIDRGRTEWKQRAFMAGMNQCDNYATGYADACKHLAKALFAALPGQTWDGTSNNFDAIVNDVKERKQELKTIIDALGVKPEHEGETVSVEKVAEVARVAVYQQGAYTRLLARFADALGTPGQTTYNTETLLQRATTLHNIEQELQNVAGALGMPSKPNEAYTALAVRLRAEEVYRNSLGVPGRLRIKATHAHIGPLDAFLSAGWTPAQLVEHGYAEYVPFHTGGPVPSGKYVPHQAPNNEPPKVRVDIPADPDPMRAIATHLGLSGQCVEYSRIGDAETLLVAGNAPDLAELMRVGRDGVMVVDKPAPAIGAVFQLLTAAQLALDEMRNTNAPRDSFTEAVDALDAAITLVKVA